MSTCDYVSILMIFFFCMPHFQILGSKLLEEQRVGEVSTRSGRGKHTTRHVSLLPLSGGGYLADTPGFNQPSLMKVTKYSLQQTFPEVCLVYPNDILLIWCITNCELTVDVFVSAVD